MIQTPLPMAPQVNVNINQATPGLFCERLHERRVVAYKLTSAKLSAISTWGEVALQTLVQWPKDRPYLALHDLSFPGVGLVYSTAVDYDLFNAGVTPARHKDVNALMIMHPQWRLAVAVVLSASLSGSIMKLKVLHGEQPNPQLRAKAFFERNAALAWLTTLYTSEYSSEYTSENIAPST